MGSSASVPKMPYLDDQNEQIARDKKVAEDYETNFWEEVSHWGTLGAVSRKKVAGWDSMRLKSNLQTAQIYDAIMTLPSDRPALVHGFMASLRG